MTTKGPSKPRPGSADDALVNGIVNLLKFGECHALFVIAIPSHNRKGKRLKLGLQSDWANAAMKLCADEFSGATAMMSHKGIYKSETGEYLWDDTILVQAFAEPDRLQEVEVLRRLVAFARDMRVTLNQEAVMLVFDNVMTFVKAA
jgi:hypothetical protein